MSKVFNPEVAKDYLRANRRPWETASGMVRMSPHSWYVGEAWVGVVLIETHDGIVMIDSGISGNMWQIFESIRKLGYDPEKDIKLCLLSHAHLDHCSGMALLQHYSHPVMYMSPFETHWLEDPASFYGHYPPEIDNFVPFQVDRVYDYKTPIEHGGVTFTVLHTPGHTEGTSSIFFDDKDEADGTVYHVALHGGMGLNYMGDACFTNAEDAAAARGSYRSMMERLLGLPVDITITNHAPNIELFERMGDERNDFHRLVDPAYWDMHIVRYLKKLDELEANSIFHQ